MIGDREYADKATLWRALDAMHRRDCIRSAGSVGLRVLTLVGAIA